MERARDLLSASLLIVKQIMAIVGYANTSNFVRHFRRYFAYTPSEYQRRAYTIPVRRRIGIMTSK